jgi:uncharacterized membrane protein
MKQKHIGFIIIGLGLLIIVLLLFMKAREDYYINLLIQEQGGSCFLDDGTCLHEDRNFFNYIFGSILSVALIIFGIYVSFFKKEGEQKKDVKESKKKSESLEPDERTVFDKVIDAQGTIFQSELVEKTGFTKVKVTRILDRLEGKGLIERKRRGMTNVVILKS